MNETELHEKRKRILKLSYFTLTEIGILQNAWALAPNVMKVLTKAGLSDIDPIIGLKAIRWHLLRKFLFSALTNVMSDMNAKLCVGKAIPTDVLTYLKGKTQQLKQEYKEAEKYFVLSGFTNSYHTELDVVKDELARQKEILGTLVDMIAKRVIELQKRQMVTPDTEIQFTLTFNEITKLLALTKPKKPRPKDS